MPRHVREQRRLIFWRGGSDPDYRIDSIVDSNRQLDLNKDVVPTDADIGSSTYLISRTWLDRKLRDCAAKGTRYVVSGRRVTVGVSPLSRATLG
ncbi:hypothetical protein TPR58_01245 [Sphingomonas sp. HF-S3]|uniref:Uncharacterized protein n=1 Tax=Sphingomonas rustica TaxID=3103142 RepID=A0ABV0B2E6_9SPHN